MASMAAAAPAKINLTLEVLRRTSDGYHELRSLAVGIELQDRVRCTVVDSPGVEIRCDDSRLENNDNLAVRAVRALAAEIGHSPALRIELDKAIPIGGGLGGGSSDAATTLSLCDKLWDLGLDRDRLAAIGATLGADIPLFFSLPSAVITGRGERVRPVDMRWSGWVLLVFVPEVVSTAEVYAAWRASDSMASSEDRAKSVLASTRAEQLTQWLCNDLEQAVFRVSPQVGVVFAALNQEGFGPMHVSGAGSTLFRLFDEQKAAYRTASAIEALGLGTECLVVAGPMRSEL